MNVVKQRIRPTSKRRERLLAGWLWDVVGGPWTDCVMASPRSSNPAAWARERIKSNVGDDRVGDKGDAQNRRGNGVEQIRQ